MSGNEYKTNTIPGAAEDDKCDFYESSRTDSGFISSGNLLVSGEITSEEIHVPHADSGLIVDQEKEYMRLDSGVCLSESFSNLNLKPGLNNLSGRSVATAANEEAKTPVESSSIADVGTDDIPWKIYYEQDEDGDTHLHTAIASSFPEVALALIRAAPHPRLLDTPNDDAHTPLHLAVETGQWRVARWLRVAGARPAPRDIRGDSPLHVAARNGDLRCVKAIVDPVQQKERDALALGYHAYAYQPCDIDQWNYLGQTCVHVASMHGHTDVLRHLVWYGADVNAREGLQGYTALHYAVERQDERMVHYLLTECKTVNPEVATYGGRNALQLNLPISTAMEEALRSKGLPSPFSSDDDEEFDGDSSEDELSYESQHMFVSNLVNASA